MPQQRILFRRFGPILASLRLCLKQDSRSVLCKIQTALFATSSLRLNMLALGTVISRWCMAPHAILHGIFVLLSAFAALHGVIIFLLLFHVGRKDAFDVSRFAQSPGGFYQIVFLNIFCRDCSI